MKNLDEIFNSKTIAVIGASAKPGTAGNDYLKVLTNFRDSSDIYPVNPNYEKIMGLKTYSSVLEVPEEVDLAYVLVPAKITPRVIEDCIEKGVKGIVVMSGGFSELGNEELEQKIASSVRKSGTRMVGPNCMGVYCPSAGVTFPTVIPGLKFPREGGKVSLISQSGGVAEYYVGLLAERGGRISKLVSTGNEADIKFTEYLKYLADDDETEVIAGYVEQIREGKNFLETTRKLAEKKPIVLWKVGRKEAAKRAASSHTGALAGSSKVYSGVFKQTGVTEAHSLDELIDYATTFSCLEPKAIEKVGIVTVPGGLGVDISDACEEEEIEIPLLSDGLQKRLRDSLPPYTQVMNPVDLTFAALENPDLLKKSIEIMGDSKEIDIIVVSDTGETIRSITPTLKECREKSEIPIAMVIPTLSILDKKTKENIRILTKAGIPIYPTSQGFAKSMNALTFYH